MSNVYVIGDLHFGHKNVHRFRTDFEDESSHTNHIVENWAKQVNKKDLVFVLGDAAFTKDGLYILKDLPGRKVLVRGNHDTLKTHEYLEVFEEVHGLYCYKRKAWFSHAPIHPAELRGRFNIHGHTHMNIMPEPQYFNACAEQINYTPVLFSDVYQALLLKEIENGTRAPLVL